ncbi:hypothetical protein [Kitasatospora sp. HPMI-4]|uniref:hypothetical protein n=1 Tax=Kitasatospora sp. HPMI-4 TaxID=3448443 RepID=UPI003F1AE8E1
MRDSIPFTPGRARGCHAAALVRADALKGVPFRMSELISVTSPGETAQRRIEAGA